MKVLVTGASSMIGRPTCDLLEEQYEVDKVLHCETDLLSLVETKKRFAQFKPDYVIALQGYNGGINFNKLLPATIFERTTEMALNVLTCCSMFNVKKVVTVLTSCAYPNTGQPLKEEEFLSGVPHESVMCHAYAKRNLFLYGLLLNKQYGLNVVSCIFNNCYGPYDSFDLEKTKVVGALIRKFIEAKENNSDKVVIWGTGNQRRELLYSRDAAKGLVTLLNEYNDVKTPINIGSGTDYSIKELAVTIKNVVGYEGELFFDTSKPDGQMSKVLDVSKMNKLFPYLDVYTPIEKGLKETVKWFYENRHLIK
jgi:nucleoside-diphosphate-sugar epimerase